MACLVADRTAARGRAGAGQARGAVLRPQFGEEISGFVTRSGGAAPRPTVGTGCRCLPHSGRTAQPSHPRRRFEQARLRGVSFPHPVRRRRAPRACRRLVRPSRPASRGQPRLVDPRTRRPLHVEACAEVEPTRRREHRCARAGAAASRARVSVTGSLPPTGRAPGWVRSRAPRRGGAAVARRRATRRPGDRTGTAPASAAPTSVPATGAARRATRARRRAADAHPASSVPRVRRSIASRRRPFSRAASACAHGALSKSANAGPRHHPSASVSRAATHCGASSSVRDTSANARFEAHARRRRAARPRADSPRHVSAAIRAGGTFATGTRTTAASPSPIPAGSASHRSSMRRSAVTTVSARTNNMASSARHLAPGTFTTPVSDTTSNGPRIRNSTAPPKAGPSADPAPLQPKGPRASAASEIARRTSSEPPAMLERPSARCRTPPRGR